MKKLFGVSVFCIIIGGWLIYENLTAAKRQLPDDHQTAEPCMLWFIGSSSIHRWSSLSRDMAPWTAHNRGIEGATFGDIVPRFSKTQSSEGRPTAIILYAGENDIARRIPVRTVAQQLEQFIAVRDRILKGVPIFVLSMKPSPGRWIYFSEQGEYNAEIKKYAAKFSNVHYVDVTEPLMIDGNLGSNYQSDQIHMNDNGYRIWSQILRQRMGEVFPSSTINACSRA